MRSGGHCGTGTSHQIVIACVQVDGSGAGGEVEVERCQSCRVEEWTIVRDVVEVVEEARCQVLGKLRGRGGHRPVLVIGENRAAV